MLKKISQKEIQTIIKTLESIFDDDQKYRIQIKNIIEIYGNDSTEAKELDKLIIKQDVVNLKRVEEIISKYSWLGYNIVGLKGNKTLFLVIQHADIEIQKKYFPIMKEAVNEGNAENSDLALLIDRIAVSEGKKQIYGSQMGYNKEKGVYYLKPLIKPSEVDKRREEVGLEPIADYISIYGLLWNKETYKIRKY